MIWWNYLLVSAISFLLGFIIDLGYLHWRGHKIVMPFISASSRNFTIAAIVFSLIALMTVVNVSNSQEESAECNRQFREALKYNTEVTAEQRDLNNRAADISADRRVLLDKTFVDIGTAIGDPVKVRQVIGDYNVRAAGLAREYDRLIAQRQALDRNRKPYPEPECGR